MKPASARAKKEWEVAEAAMPELMTAERERLQTRPTGRSANPRRTAKLQGGLATKRVGDKKLAQWQHELTGAGRIWYCPDPDERVVWVTMVSLAHPRATD